MNGKELFKYKLFVKTCLVVTLLIFPVFTAVQSQDTCKKVEYRIANFESAFFRETFRNGTFFREALKGSAEIQFYNPNDRNTFVWFPVHEPLNLLNISGEVLNESHVVHGYSGGYIGHIVSVWNFSPGISIVPVSFTVWVVNRQNIALNAFPDGNFTFTHLYADYLSGYSTILEVKSGEVTPRIPEPDWNYEKQGTYTKVYGDPNACENTSTNSSIPPINSSIPSTNDNVIFSTLFISSTSFIGILLYRKKRKHL